MDNSNIDKNGLIDLSIISSVLFIFCLFISLSITINEKREKKIYTNKQALDISFYNRILILIAVLISLYVSYTNYKREEDNTIEKYKSTLLLTTNIVTVISACIILYVAYLNRKDQSLTISDIQNPLA